MTAVILKKEFTKYIMNSAVIQKVSQQYFYMAAQVEDAANFREDSSIQKNIELFFLIKGGVEIVNLILA